jgi:NADH-quinone oxidoreductase subunit F
MGNHRKFIFVCNGSDCKGEGCKDLGKEIKELIQSGHNKGKYKIIKTKCMDFCKSAPVVIYHGEVIKKADVAHVRKKIEH